MTPKIRPRVPAPAASATIVESKDESDYRRLVVSFQSAIAKDDDLGVVIRTHILIERIMNNAVARLSLIHPRSDKVIKLRKSLAKVRSARSLDIDVVSATKLLDTLRHRFAHEDYALNVSDVQKMDSYVSRFSYVPEPKIPMMDPLQTLKDCLFQLFAYWLHESLGYVRT